MVTPSSSPLQTEGYTTPQSLSNHIPDKPISHNTSKASAMATPSSSPPQTKTKEYKTKFHFIKAYALYCGTPSLTFNQEHRDMKAFVKSLYHSQTPAERLREIDRRMWQKYGKFMPLWFLGLGDWLWAVKDEPFPWSTPVIEKEPDLPPAGIFTPPSPCYFPAAGASDGD